MNKCPYCDKECKNKNSLAQHRNRCAMNESRTAVGFVKGMAKPPGSGLVRGNYDSDRLIPLSSVLVENSTYPRRSVKRRLLREGILKYQCVLCGNDGTHNGIPLTLQLDHINGVNNDHRLDNLRLLCPNCHTQQDTYAGKNKPRKQESETEKEPSFLEIKLDSDRKKWNSIKSMSELRFGEWGWRTRLGKEIGINGQKVNNWLKRVDPEFLEKVKNM